MNGLTLIYLEIITSLSDFVDIVFGWIINENGGITVLLTKLIAANLIIVISVVLKSFSMFYN